MPRQRLAALAALAARPALRWWALAVVVNRLLPAMGVLGLILAGQHATGSLADGALLLAASAVGFAAAAPWRGRALDRVELRAGLQRDCLLAAASTAALAVAVAAQAPLALLAALGAATGVATAALEGGFRALLPAVVAREDLSRASALEAVLGEVSFLSGPALAGVVAHWVGPVAVLALMAAAPVVAAAAALRLPRRVAGRPSSGDPRGVWRRPGARAVYGVALAAGGVVGLFESAMPARVEGLGQPAAAAGGYLTAAYLASLLGGLVAAAVAGGPRAQATAAPRRAAVLLACCAAGLAAAAAAGSPASLGAGAIAAGATIAPLYALGAIVVQTRLPAGRQAEGFAVFIAAQALGGGLGNAVTSQLLEVLGGAGVLWLAAAAAAATALALTAAALGRSRRAPPAAPAPPAR